MSNRLPSAFVQAATKVRRETTNGSILAFMVAATAGASTLTFGTGEQDEQNQNKSEESSERKNLSSLMASSAPVIEHVKPSAGTATLATAAAFPVPISPMDELLSNEISRNSNDFSSSSVLAPSTYSESKHAILRRQQTLRAMDEHSTKGRSVESRYSVDWNSQPLGEGAFGLVYLAQDKITKEHVALKKITKEHTDNESFQREMRALLEVKSFGGHPNICALREFYDNDDEYYYVIFDFVSGGEMFDHLVDKGAFSEADAAFLVRQVAGALAFMHGVGVVHADLKPENLMLSSRRRQDAVVKLVDFGGAEVLDEDEIEALPTQGKNDNEEEEEGDPSAPKHVTPAYCPPEAFSFSYRRKETPMDMWSLGLIVYIMLTGAHPFDIDGDAPDEIVVDRIRNKSYRVPLRRSPVTKHLSESAIDLIEKLMNRDPKKRLTAFELLKHPWVLGETARTDIMAGSGKRLKGFREFKTRLQARFFHDVVNWSDFNEDEIRRKTSLIEQSFRSLDQEEKGYLSKHDLGGGKGVNTDEDTAGLSMSQFEGLLSENMLNKYYPKGHILYKEGDVGNHMYFINSGSVEVTTKDGSVAKRKQGDFFGEGALLHPKKIRSATIKCLTPIHAIEVSREYFEKYLASDTSGSGLLITLSEKDKIRKRNRAKTILRLQENVEETRFKDGEHLFNIGDSGNYIFMVEKGVVDITVDNRQIFSVTPGNICGEYSLLTNKPRNCTAVCRSEDGCMALKMSQNDFQNMLDVSPGVKASLSDLSMRRDFKKAIVTRLQKDFPYRNPREAFASVDKKGVGILDLASVSEVMKEMDPNYSDDRILALFDTLDLTKSGKIDYDEFCKVFVANMRTSASI